MPDNLERHGDRIARNLFEENTGQAGSLGSIVDRHAGDSVSLSANELAHGGADSGEADFEAEMNSSDPADDWEQKDDEFVGGREDTQGIGETDITGTAAGIARGFGSHMALDLGSDGFQIEEIPDAAIGKIGSIRDGEELDDYDDDDPNNGKFDPRDLEGLSIPGSSPGAASQCGGVGESQIGIGIGPRHP